MVRRPSTAVMWRSVYSTLYTACVFCLSCGSRQDSLEVMITDRGSCTGPEFDGPQPAEPDRRPKFDKGAFDGRPEPRSKVDILTPPGSM